MRLVRVPIAVFRIHNEEQWIDLNPEFVGSVRPMSRTLNFPPYCEVVLLDGTRLNIDTYADEFSKAMICEDVSVLARGKEGM